MPDDILSAYENAYPNLASEMPLKDAISSMESDDEIRGFISGIKGKLFELKYVDYLNDSELHHYDGDTFETYQLYKQFQFNFLKDEKGNINSLKCQFESSVAEITFIKVPE